MQEIPVSFVCDQDWLYGMLHVPAQPATRGVLVVVGGPQYRVGSHRQFVLLARDLMAAGIPVLRFDYRGMGDSAGVCGMPEPCEHIGPDIRAAVDTFFAHVPGLKEVVIWGLCDGASGALLYAYQDERITGLVLLNPWVGSEQSKAKAYVKHYYLQRVMDPELWRKLRRGELGFFAALSGFTAALMGAWGMKKTKSPEAGQRPAASIAERMAEGLARFKGRVLLILSGQDLTAAEFKELVSASRRWQKLLKSTRLVRRDFPEANHTFARRQWRDQVAAMTRDWVKEEQGF